MTNGEKLIEVFPSIELYKKTHDGILINFDSTWWNAEYKEPTKSCRTCRSYKGHAGHCEICHNMSMYKKVESTTKNDLPHCHHTDEEIAKSFIEDVEAVKDQLPTTKNDLAQERYQDLIEYFGDEKVAKTILEDRKEFKAWLERVKWHVKRADELAGELEQLKGTTKNNLGVDTDELISHCEKMSFDIEIFNKPLKVVALDAVKNIVKNLSSVTPQEPFINKSCVSSEVCEHDKNKVLDKIRAEIIEMRSLQNCSCADCLDIIDKYKAESEK